MSFASGRLRVSHVWGSQIAREAKAFCSVTPTNVPSSIGRYDVIDRLGRGGMGVVFRGRDPRIGRLVAIKLLHVNDEGLRERFLQEAQSAGNLKHRNIVTIYDFGEHEGQPFIVMEFVEGVTLADEIRANPEWPLSAKLDLILAGTHLVPR